MTSGEIGRFIYKIEQMEKEALSQIGDASSKGDLEGINRLSRLVSGCRYAKSQSESLIQFVDGLESVFKGRSATLPQILPGPLKPKGPKQTTSSRTSSGRGACKQIRGAWVDAQTSSGYLLRRISPTVYDLGDSETLVGVACATERPKIPNKWFLGLPDKLYQVIVLLCQNDSGNLLDFVLPLQAFENIFQRLSRSDGQVKFHVEKNGRTTMLRIPGGEHLTLDPFLGNYSPLS